MKKRLLTSLMLLAVCLVGCSKGEPTLATRNGVIYNGDKEVKVTEHSGTTASSMLAGGQYTIDYSFHPDFNSCPHNQAGVTEDNVTEYDKKKGLTYYTMYLNSNWVMHKAVEGGMVCGFVRTESEAESNLVLSQMATEIENLDLSTPYTKAVMDDVITVTNFNEIKVRPNEIVLPGILMIAKDQVKTEKTATIGETTVGFISSDKYDYYQWNEYVIKAQKGYDVNQCITLIQPK